MYHKYKVLVEFNLDGIIEPMVVDSIVIFSETDALALLENGKIEKLPE